MTFQSENNRKVTKISQIIKVIKLMKA